METRDQLMHAALKLIALNGFEQVTLDQIAAETANTKGAVYHHFASKADLYREALEHLAETLARASNPGTGVFGGGSITELLVGSLSGVRKAGVELANGDVYYLLFDGMRRFPELRSRLQLLNRGFMSRLAAHLNGATGSGGEQNADEEPTPVGLDSRALLYLVVLEGVGLVQEITGGMITEADVRAMAKRLE